MFVFLLIILFFNCWQAHLVSKKHPSDIRVIFYLFSLSFVLTVIAAVWALKTGVMDVQGVFHGAMGDKTNAFLRLMLDLDSDVGIFSSILIVILVPQFLSYILSAPFGSSAAPIFVGKTIRIFIWSVIKSFVVAAGILQSISIYGFYSHWKDWSFKGAVTMTSMSGLLLFLAFLMLYFFHDIDDAMDEPAKNPSSKTLATLKKIHQWATRRTSGLTYLGSAEIKEKETIHPVTEVSPQK